MLRNGQRRIGWLSLCLVVLLLFSSCRWFCKHTAESWTIVKEATYSQAGERHKVCERCGTIYDEQVIEQLTCDHAKTEWIVDVAATYEEEGSRHQACSDCGETLKTETVPVRLTKEQIVEKVGKSVFKVINYAQDGKTAVAQGSGFFVGDNGVFVTNAHVAQDACYMKIKTMTSSKGTLIDVSALYAYNYTNSDYAVARASVTYKTTALELTDEVAEGDTVYALGFPNDAGKIQVTAGKVTAINRWNNKGRYLVHSAEIDHGSSGGALVDEWGRVVGITTGEWEEGNYAAVKSTDFKEALPQGYVDDAKTPLDFFYETTRVHVNEKNVDQYFTLEVREGQKKDTSVNYVVSILVKEGLHEKVALNQPISFSFTVTVDTLYEYTDTSFGKRKQQMDTKQVSGSVHHLNWSKYIDDSIVSRIFPRKGSYYDLETSYTASFTHISGSFYLLEKRNIE